MIYSRPICSAGHTLLLVDCKAPSALVAAWLCYSASYKLSFIIIINIVVVIIILLLLLLLLLDVLLSRPTHLLAVYGLHSATSRLDKVPWNATAL